MAAESDTDLRETRAVTRHLRIAPSKLRIVADLIRGMPVIEAQRILDFSNRGTAPVIRKTLDSAVANSENGELGLGAEELYVSRIFADEGPTRRRFQPRARGRATRIRMRTSHLTIHVAEIPEED